jgi:hypothetical protein
MTTADRELTPDQLEAVSGGLVGGLMAIAFATGFGCAVGGLGEDHTPTNISNGILNLLNNPPAGW